MPARKQYCSSCRYEANFADMWIAIFVAQGISVLFLHLLNFSLHTEEVIRFTNHKWHVGCSSCYQQSRSNCHLRAGLPPAHHQLKHKRCLHLTTDYTQALQFSNKTATEIRILPSVHQVMLILVTKAPLQHRQSTFRFPEPALHDGLKLYGVDSIHYFKN